MTVALNGGTLRLSRASAVQSLCLYALVPGARSDGEEVVCSVRC